MNLGRLAPQLRERRDLRAGGGVGGSERDDVTDRPDWKSGASGGCSEF